MKLFEIFTFGIYIRFYLEAYQNMLLSSVQEIKVFNAESVDQIVSLVWAFFIVTLCLTFLIFVFIKWLKSRNQEKSTKHSYFDSIFSGLRDSWFARLYLLLNFGRRSLLIVIGIMDFHNTISKIITFWLVQLLYLITLFILKPFETKKENAIELINESFFTLFVGCLLYLNKEHLWSNILADIYMYGILTNNAITNFIMLGKFFICTLAHLHIYIKPSNIGALAIQIKSSKK